MSMIEWAKREVANACKEEDSYGIECYESALKAFEYICSDDHSGTSVKFTKNILNRLIDGKILTPVTDEPTNWNGPLNLKRDYEVFQCTRMSSLFKKIYSDRSVKYNDINRYYCRLIDNPNSTYNSKLIENILDEMYPITMPYYPTENPFQAITEELLTDTKNGDYDSVALKYIIEPNGKKIEVNRYFKEDNNTYVEIDEGEWNNRKKLHNERLMKIANNN